MCYSSRPLTLQLHRDYQSEWERNPQTAKMYEKCFFLTKKPHKYTFISLLTICQVLNLTMKHHDVEE